MSRTPMAERTQKGSQFAAQGTRRGRILFAAGLLRLKRSAEDVGYFAPLEKRVRIPPLASRTVEAARQGRRVAGSVVRKDNLRWRH
jgi:hypothetical protein